MINRLLLTFLAVCFLLRLSGAQTIHAAIFGNPVGDNGAAADNIEGKKILLWETFHTRDSWADIERPHWAVNTWGEWRKQNPKYNVILSFAPIAPGASLDACARGEYSSHHEAAARNLANAGQTDVIVRLGWEWEGNWYHWAVNMDVDRAQAYGGCIRETVKAFRRAVPNNEWIFDWYFPSWQPERNRTFALASAGYPGDEYVDIVSSDLYDSDHDLQRLDLQFSLLKEFASRHNKPIALGEWGLWDQDHPEYIEYMCKAINDPANRVIYHVYFNVPSLPQHMLDRFPRSQQAFRMHCRDSDDATVHELLGRDLSGLVPTPARCGASR